MSKHKPSRDESNLALPDRKIWVVTTASLPWRTGTSINPLLRALYLTRGRPSKSVSLVVPWLPSKNDRDVLYGEAAKDWPKDSELSSQEKCIRKFASDECGMVEEENALRILFYRAAYVKSFGSIFPTEDICDIIPDEDADVAILEEPEHLNWFRMPASSTSIAGTVSGGVIRCLNSTDNDAVVKEKRSAKFSNSFERSSCQKKKEEQEEEKKEDKTEERVLSDIHDKSNYRLGWTHKFRFVVGICHTNYAAYVKQYGIGASVIAAPAITAFNALVVRAYCDRVIKLSDTLQEFVPEKEVTCNVHGVRPDFLTPSTKDHDNEATPIGGSRIPCVYFIGKLLWAKGFDDMLEIQDRYRKRTGDFFAIHVYGSGPDENAIKRAFFGRQMVSVRDKGGKSPWGDTESESSSPIVETVFSNPTSLRSQSIELLKKEEEERNMKQNKSQSLGFEVTIEGCDALGSINYVEEAVESTEDECLKNSASPLNIIGDVSTSSFSTGFATSVAACKIGDVAVKNILSLVFAPERNAEKQSDESCGKSFPRYVFDPPQSRFELRRHPVSASFLGVMDHALVKNTSLKIFLNPSVSEVLCTTTAEALAMGKFVIIPRHSSNYFFEQFPNALMYDSLEDAVDRILFAMDNDPTPLNAVFSRLLSWEAATERLIKASMVHLNEESDSTTRERKKKDLQIAWLHSEASKTTHFLGSILPTNDTK